jgi:putative ABC transport system permease protein
MLRNYIKVALRNLLKNKIFTIINIVGLGVALSVCIVAYFNHMFNYDFDRTHKNFNKIYRITSFRDMQGREQEYGIVPASLGLEIKKDIPGVEKAARLVRSTSPVKEGNNLFSTEISYVDPEFLEIFTFPPVIGDAGSLKNQANVLLSQTMARRLYGEQFPIGKTLSVINDAGKEFTYTVGAVFKDLPQNSSFEIDILTHFDNFLQMWDVRDTDWKIWANALFIEVSDKSLIGTISKDLKNYLPVQNRAREDFRINRFNIIPLKDVGESTRKIWSSGLFPALHPAAVVAPPIMAIFILLIACFNFANTSIATFSRRLKEIGLRKTFGGLRRQLVTQFMFETVVVCILALFTGIAIAEFLVPAYSSLWSYMSIQLTFAGHWFFWIFLILLVSLTGFLAGVYPAIYVSSFSPVNVLKGTSSFGRSGRFSMILLTLQFSISIMSLVMGIVFARNATYQETLDMGFDRDNLIIVSANREIFNSYRNEILTNPKVISAEGTQNHIGYGNYRRPVKDQGKQLEVDVLDIGSGYAKIMGLRLLDGRLFDESRAGADISNKSVIVNQKLVKDFGWKDPVGKTMTVYDTTKLTVIGVVEDFYTRGVWQAMEPTVLRIIPENRYGLLIVRAKTEDLPGILEFMSSKWKSLSQNRIFDGRLEEDLLQEGKDINRSIMKVNFFLAITAALLSLIGMYNLVSLDIIRRTKEVGIRKIQGAPVPIIIYLISKKFLVVLLIASVLGCAGGYYVSLKLLDSIWDYFVNISAGILMISVAIMFTATILTILYKIGRAAVKNPVESLRYE